MLFKPAKPQEDRPTFSQAEPTTDHRSGRVGGPGFFGDASLVATFTKTFTNFLSSRKSGSREVAVRQLPPAAEAPAVSQLGEPAADDAAADGSRPAVSVRDEAASASLTTTLKSWFKRGTASSSRRKSVLRSAATVREPDDDERVPSTHRPLGRVQNDRPSHPPLLFGRRS